MRLDLLQSDFGQIVARVVIEGNISALAREDFAERCADAARAAADESSLPFQQKTQVSLSPKKPASTGTERAAIAERGLRLKPEPAARVNAALQAMRAS